jgi:hypothetical protein
MGQKRYGPTLDAGVVIIEKEAEKTIQASQLGSTAYVGVLERGPVGELITTTGKRDLLAKCGSYVPEHLLPDSCIDFWDHSNGSGVLFLYRVTDGNEVKASLTLYDRKNPRNPVVRVDANNGGGWGGKRDNYVVDLSAVPGDITSETEIDLPIAFHPIQKDQFKGGTVRFSETGKTYDIISNDASDGVAKTKLTVAADAKLQTDFASGTDAEIFIAMASLDAYGQEKHLAVKIMDGQIAPSTTWGIEVYLNGDLVLAEPDMSSDPNSRDYFVDKVNDNASNHYITLTDLWTGAVSADCRPANHFGEVASATEITQKQLKLQTALVVVDSSLAGANTIGSFTFGDEVVEDEYELTYVLASTWWTVTSKSKQTTHAFPTATGGVAYTADNKWSFGFTITESAPSDGEKFTVKVIPLVQDEAIDGRIYFPEESGAPGEGWFITDNDEKAVDITSGDLTLGGTITGDVKYRLEYLQQLSGGYDGTADVDLNDFLPAFDVNTSEFNKTVDQGYGLIKFATPGITELLSAGDAVSVQKLGRAYALAKNHQFRVEVPKNLTDDAVVKDWLLNTMGLSEYSAICFPSYASVPDPVKTGLLKDVCITGQIHGRESLVAKNYDGYHKVAAGIDVTLPRIRKLPIGDRLINGELLNPVGFQTVRKKQGNWVLWGARLPASDPAFKFKQHRETLSYYEHVLQEAFPWILFAINDKAEWPGLIAAFKSFFIPEWRKRAIRGDTFEDAARIKIDDENNTNLTMAAGDLNAEITLRLADTVERFIITIGKAGIFEDLAA